ncbi:MAG TPA: 2-oxo acid dehydrogenase subunit E2, partial [Oligoflexia bacterium]|nr:2-oxo acid dehydrogenase subunit E2 [Oligoflexia bacterium]
MEFKLPDIGEGVHEGEIVKWLVKEGDSVKVDQPMVEIMTDKATVEIPTSTAGVIQKLNAKEGDVVKVGQVIAVLGSSGSEVAQTQAPAAKPAASAPKPAAPAAKPGASVPKPAVAAAMTPAPAPQRSSVSPTTSSYTATPGNVLATPATRRLARDLGVDLSRVDPTGPHGRVTKEDVQRFGGASAAGPAMPVSNHGTSLARSSASLPARGRAGGGELETLVPFRGIRRKISEAMSRSRTLIPEFTYVDEVNVSELVAFRKEVKEIAEKQGVKLTYLPFICKALIRAFREFPTLN